MKNLCQSVDLDKSYSCSYQLNIKSLKTIVWKGEQIEIKADVWIL